MKSKALHVRTPVIESSLLSQKAECKVYLKLENAQPTSCFKIRGIGNLICKAVESGHRKFVTSSGGNAGMAAAYSAHRLGVEITIFVPITTPEFLNYRMRLEGATVIVHGEDIGCAIARAKEEAQQSGALFLHPSDHPDIWEGNASWIHEVHEDLDERPDLIVLAVGGGGMAIGTIFGLERVGWESVPVLCMETEGADCFHAALKAGTPVTLPAIRSIAKCLGAPVVAPKLLDEYHMRPILSELVNDKECLQAVLSYLEDHKVLVEPACGAALAALYTGRVKKLQEEEKLGEINSILVMVCGGLGVNQDCIEAWKREIGFDS